MNWGPKMKDVDKIKARENLKSLLDSIPESRESHEDILKFAEEITTSGNVLNALWENSRKNLYFASTLIKIKSLLDISGSTQKLLENFAENGLFEEVNHSEKYRDKVISLIESYLKLSIERQEAQEENLTKIMSLDRELMPINDALKEIEDKLESILETKGQEIDSRKFSLLEEKIKLEESKKTLSTQRNSLTKSMGSLSQALIHYAGISGDLNDHEFLKAALSQPEYQYKILSDPNKTLEENEIGIGINSSGELILKSTLGQKELKLQIKDAEHQGISTEAYQAILSAIRLKSDLILSPETIKDLYRFSALNNFPGVFKNTYLSVMDFVYLSKENAKTMTIPKRKIMVDRVLELITQKHVAKTLTPLATQKLIDDIFSLPTITPTVQTYHELVHNLAKDQDKFQHLFGSLTKQGAELRTYVSSLMDFIYTAENDPKFISIRAGMLDNLVNLVTKSDVTKNLKPLASQELVDDIFKLPSVTPQVKVYHTLVHNLAEDQSNFQNLFTALAHKNPGFNIYLSDLMKYIYPEQLNGETKEQAEQRTFDKSMLSLVDAIRPEVIEAAIPLINKKLIEDVVHLPNVKKALGIYEGNQSADKWTKKTQEEATKVINSPELQKQFIAERGQEAFDKLTEQLKQHQSGKSVEKSKNPPEPNPLMDKIVSSIKELGNKEDNCKSIRSAVTRNKTSLTKSLDALIASPAGKTLDNFCLTGEQVADFLPKVLNKKGLDAIANYTKDASTWNLIQIFAQTNTLAFATKHLLMSYTKPLWKGKEVEDIKKTFSTKEAVLDTSEGSIKPSLKKSETPKLNLSSKVLEI